MRCHDCDNGFECCHETSVRHADGTTECLGAQPCTLAHDLHVWAVDAGDVFFEVEEPALLPLAA
jgi:hypothetical protein